MDATFRDRAVYLGTADALVIADLHVGRDEASAVELPLGERADLADRLGALLRAFDPGTVVFAGDVFHSFDRVTPAMESSLAELVGACRDAGARPVLVAGNHDTVLPAAWDGDVHDAFRLRDGTVVCHGHGAPDPDADRYVVGHDHPAITIEGDRHPCYLFGPAQYRGAAVLMVPAFTRLAAGAPVNRMRTDDFQSPLVTDADALRPIVPDPAGGDPLRFPPLGEFRRML